ncbi:hypothetical protein BDR03DRAFT_1003676 [Suillus americanus]|nr:hypothetical protein BDR03DRAFT_1003676 [Suillus americanus]
MPDGPCPEWIVNCGTCHRVLEWFVCKTSDNGNQGKWMVRCTEGGCYFFRTAYGKNGTPLQSPELSQGESQSPPLMQNAHVSDKLDDEVLELSDNLTDREEDLPPPPPPAVDPLVAGPSNGKGKNRAIPPHPNRRLESKPPRKPTSESNTQPKHSLQLPPLFTAQLEQEHDLDEKQRQRDAVRIKSSQREKYSVTVHAFVQNGEPPSSFVFQTGFQWPHFYLTYEVLRELDLPATNLEDGYQPSKLRLFDPGARAWRGIHQDHMITLQSHEESLILRASDVT